MKVKIGKYPKNGDLPKVDIQIDNYDLWSADYTMSLIIYEVLLRFRNNVSGVPSCILSEVYGSDYTLNEEYRLDINLERATEHWQMLLDKMIFSFGEIANNYPKEEEVLNNKELWNAYHKDIQDGIDLFAKHYRSLWT